MKTISIIAEYNPFHNGHAWQIAEAKRRTSADFALIVMSGDFVQRGEPAVLDKFSRTRMALLGGADLVLELPVRYAAGSAEYFARGACSLLASLNVTDTLCFDVKRKIRLLFRLFLLFLQTNRKLSGDISDRILPPEIPIRRHAFWPLNPVSFRTLTKALPDTTHILLLTLIL